MTRSADWTRQNLPYISLGESTLLECVGIPSGKGRLADIHTLANMSVERRPAFSAPLKSARRLPITAFEPAPMHTSSLAPKLKTFDALVADDDAGVRDLLTDFLSERGLEVASASDGRGAVAALERSGARCRLVLADIAMPGADGFAVLTAARLANPSSYVVMMTGYGSLETAINAVRLGAQDYLTKPFSLGEVDVILRQVAARHELEQEQRRRIAEPSAEALARIDARLEAIERQLLELTAHIVTRG